ncbi:MAG: hypothetical protein AB7N80_14295 [Bdellovibrionales bacterium]
MNRITLSTVLTAALTSVFFAGISAQAQTVATQETLAAALINKGLFVCLSKDGKSFENEKPECKEAMARMTNDTKLKECKEEMKSFDDAYKDLRGSCGEARMFLNMFAKATDSSSEKRDEIGQCIDNVNRCVQCEPGSEDLLPGGAKCGTLTKKDSDDDLYKDQTQQNGSQVLNSFMSGMSGGAMGTSGLKREDLEKEVLSCVQRSAEGLTDIRTRVKDYRKEIRAEEKELLDAQADLAEINQAVQNKRNAAQDRAEEIQSKSTEAIDRIKDKLDEQTQAALSQYTANNNAMETDIRRLERAKVQAELAYTESVVNLDRGCHANALARVETYRKEMLDLMKQSAYTSGNFNQLMTGVGRSSRNKFQILAKKFYDECKNDRAYKSVVESSQRAKKNAVDTANEEIAAIRARQKQATQEINQLRTTANAKAMKDMTRVSTEMTKALTALDRETQAESRKATQKLMTKGLEVNALGRNVAESRADLEEDQERIRLAKKYGRSSTGIKEGAVDKAISSAQAAQVRAERAAASCCIDASSDSQCKQACSFLGSAGLACGTAGSKDFKIEKKGSAQ